MPRPTSPPARLPLLVAVTVLGLAALSIAGCRDVPTCVSTFNAECACNDPRFPELMTCTASSVIESCALDAGFDPCVLNPCCENVPRDGRDGGAPADAAQPIADGGPGPG